MGIKEALMSKIFKKLPGSDKEAKFELSAQERQKPYAKYYDFPVAVPNKELVKILDQGPMDPSKALMPENINDLLNPGYHEVETGYCRLPNGTGYVAVNNKFPGATVEMIKWWFAWHPIEDMRYMLWYKPGHHGTSVGENDRAKILDSNTDLDQKIHGSVHHVIENIGCGVEDIQISFLAPEELGFDMSRFKSPAVGTVIGANGISQNRAGGPQAPAIMLHFVREIPGGVELRTRFWMGYHMVNGKHVKKLPPFIKVPMESIKGLAYHCVEEYSNLAAILPAIYEENKDIWLLS